MLLFLAAEASRTNWEVIISAIGVILIQLYGMHLSAKGRKIASVKSKKQEVKIDKLVQQTDGLLKSFGDGKILEGAELERLKQVEMDAAVIVAIQGNQSQPSPKSSDPVDVVVKNPAEQPAMVKDIS